jgi:hypothetical protein
MVIALAVLLTAAALLAVAYPIIRARTSALPAGDASEEAASPLLRGNGFGPRHGQPNLERLEELLAQRENAMQALRELSFDRQVGKVGSEDYGAFETNLKLAAAGTLRALDQWEAEADRGRTATLRLGAVVCPACGHSSPAADHFCGNCGAALAGSTTPAAVAVAADRCSHCQRPSEPDDKFCAGCGKPLQQPVASRA